MKKWIFLSASILFLLFAAFRYIQDDESLKNLLTQIDRFHSEHPQEKVHIHFDKPYYAIGDTIWFKAYVVNAEKNELSALSRILYVDLINDKDSIKNTLRLPLEFGLAAGDFTLGDSLREGNYRIRAYTQWMRNFGEDYFFDKTIMVGNAISNRVLTDISYSFSKTGNSEAVEALIRYTDLDGNPLKGKDVSYNVDLDFRNISNGATKTDSSGRIRVQFVNSQPFILKSGRIQTQITLDDKQKVSKLFPVKSTSSEASTEFFPEGGDLVAGIPSRVAFKAIGADGLGVPVSGYLTGKGGARIASFKSEHLGMGNFSFTPVDGDDYTAHIQYEDGSQASYPLPRPLQKGYVLSVDNSDPESLFVRIQTNELPDARSQLTLIAQTNGRVNFVAKNRLSGESFSTRIPKSRFPTGILQLTVFSPANLPVAERLVFIDHQDRPDIKVTSSKSEYSVREKVRLKINPADVKGQPITGSFSVAVTDETKVPFDDEMETTILSNLLLSSDLRGFIERPNYYFSSHDASRRRHLDLLLTTQGWRRFEWKNVLAPSFPSLSFRPERDIEISGRVRAINNGRPVVGGRVTLFSSSGDVFLRDTITDSNGEFRFDNLYFSDSTKFIIQARNENDRRNVEIELNRVPPQLVTRNKNEPMIQLNVNRAILPYLENSRNWYQELRRYGLVGNSIVLNEVKVVERRPVVRNSSNLNGAGNADAIVRSDQLLNCVNVAQCLQGRIAGVVFMNGIAYSTRSMNSSFRGPVPMQLVIDGAYVEPTFLSMMNPNDIETIEVLRSGGNTAIYGIRGGGGVLVINTKRPEINRDYRSYAPGITSYNPKGIYTARQFYSPDYDVTSTSKMPDLRSTVYWNANLVPDSTGSAAVEFYNTDSRGTYKVVVEGISISGKPGRAVYRYTVK